MSGTELVAICIAVTLIVIGCVSIAAWSLRARRDELAPLLFGIWCAMYGVRMMGVQAAVQATIGGSPAAWHYLSATITYSINIPVVLFFESLIGPGWKQSLRRLRQVQTLYAAGAILYEVVSRRPGAAAGLNNPLVLAALVVFTINVAIDPARRLELRRSRAAVAGGLVMLLAVVNENIGRPLAPAFNLEPIGVLCFVLCLGYVVALGVFRREAALASVERELVMARRIQASLLPRTTPAVAGFDLAAHYVPMTAVAGDLYDFVTLGPTAIGVLVADVSGHGVPAALVASMVKLEFTAQAERARDPADVIAGMNRILCRHLEHSHVTAVYAVLDSETGTMEVSSAGHPPVLIHGAAATPVVAGDDHGPMMGFFPEAVFTCERFALHHGDRILIYTDGLPEAQNASGEFFDTERVKQMLSAPAGNAA
ncbi:MAG: PP2C family protein-serine/threonine phosphatase, partial [Acidobacteriota bacterium]